MSRVTIAAPGNARAGEASDGSSTLAHRPCHCITLKPAAAIAAPATPPIRAWLELDGRPKYQVIKFQVIAPIRPASTTFRVMASGLTIPCATVAATFSERNAPAKLSSAEPAIASRGKIARVDTLVAIA